MNNDQPRSGNPLTQKFGPLPVWAWLALITGVLLAYYLYSRRKSSSTSTAGTPAPVVFDTPNTQSTTPTQETGLTAAQEKELATLQSQESGIQDVIADDKKEDAEGKKKKKPPPKKRRAAPASTHTATAKAA